MAPVGADWGDIISVLSKNGFVERGRSGRSGCRLGDTGDVPEGERARLRKGLFEPRLIFSWAGLCSANRFTIDTLARPSSFVCCLINKSDHHLRHEGVKGGKSLFKANEQMPFCCTIL